MATAAILRELVIAYAALGLAVGVAFLMLGIDRLDPAAAGCYAFRPLLLPGLILLWPLVALRWARFALARFPLARD